MTVWFNNRMSTDRSDHMSRLQFNLSACGKPINDGIAVHATNSPGNLGKEESIFFSDKCIYDTLHVKALKALLWDPERNQLYIFLFSNFSHHFYSAMGI